MRFKFNYRGPVICQKDHHAAALIPSGIGISLTSVFASITREAALQARLGLHYFKRGWPVLLPITYAFAGTNWIAPAQLKESSYWPTRSYAR
jgi:hypothetical protein